MAWFSIRIIFEIKGNKFKSKRYPESIFLLKAKNEEKALKKIIDYVHKNVETSYKNYLGETISWKMKKILDVHELLDDTLKQITEVYSCFYDGWYPKRIKKAYTSTDNIKKKKMAV